MTDIYIKILISVKKSIWYKYFIFYLGLICKNKLNPWDIEQGFTVYIFLENIWIFLPFNLFGLCKKVHYQT